MVLIDLSLISNDVMQILKWEIECIENAYIGNIKMFVLQKHV